MTEALTIDEFSRIVLIEDILILVFGMYIGGFIMAFLICNMLTKTKAIQSSYFDKMSFVRFLGENGEKTYFINTNKKNTFELMRAIILIVFSPSCISRSYVVNSKKRSKIFVGFLLLVGIVVSIMAIFAILKVTTPALLK